MRFTAPVRRFAIPIGSRQRRRTATNIAASSPDNAATGPNPPPAFLVGVRQTASSHESVDSVDTPSTVEVSAVVEGVRSLGVIVGVAAVRVRVVVPILSGVSVAVSVAVSTDDVGVTVAVTCGSDGGGPSCCLAAASLSQSQT